MFCSFLLYSFVILCPGYAQILWITNYFTERFSHTTNLLILWFLISSILSFSKGSGLDNSSIVANPPPWLAYEELSTNFLHIWTGYQWTLCVASSFFKFSSVFVKLPSFQIFLYCLHCCFCHTDHVSCFSKNFEWTIISIYVMQIKIYCHLLD